MLQNIRDHSQGWIAKSIIGFIVAIMAGTGFYNIYEGSRSQPNAATVNGDKISQDELRQAIDMQRRQLAQQMGKDFDPAMLDENLLHESALKGLIDRRLLLQSADKAKFVFSDAALDQVILQTPEFQQDGKFNADRFDAVIRSLGYTRMQFRQMYAQEMLISQLRAGLANSGFVTDAEVLSFARLEKQTRDFASLTLKPDLKAAKVTDDEVKAYYDQHAKEFMTPEQVVIDYVQLKKADFFSQVSVKDEDLQEAYKKEISGLVEQRRASHILIAVNNKVSDAQAKSKIEETQARLAKGENFAALAKELSQDPGSSGNGGDLGFAGKGVYDPAFENALYALKPGEVSAPVKTSFGWHLIKLTAVEAPKVPTFDSLKEKLTHELKAAQVEQLFVEQTKKLEDSAYQASDLAQPAQDLKLKVLTSAPFGRDGGEGILANRAVIQAAFSPEVLESNANSSAIELDPETVIVLRDKEHRKPTQLTQDSVAANIRDQLIKDHAAAAVKARGEAVLADLRSGKLPAKQAVDGQTWQALEAVTRNQDGVDPNVLQSVFRMPRPASADKPEFTGISQRDGSYVLARLNGVNDGAAPTEQEKTSYRSFLSSRSGQQDFAAYRKQLQVGADIKRN